MNAVVHNHTETRWLTKERFVAGGAAAVAVDGRGVLGIRFGSHDHAPEQAAVCFAFHQQAADELGGNLLGGAGEEGVGEVLGGRGGYGSGFCEEVLRDAEGLGVVGDNVGIDTSFLKQ